ncbi:hypothetical protein LTR41_010952 [Exophiala xenobiotica]|nr:hypothetical protein LTR41_010952 [Exophiala xenobiotica]KAK5551120.1 hypothetical protein LTR46_010873 [Exophiala xenobiotica]
MTKVTILGDGVVGMSIASQLPTDHEITIWTGAIWLGVHNSSRGEQEMQLDALAVLYTLAGTNLESSIRES